MSETGDALLVPGGSLPMASKPSASLPKFEIWRVNQILHLIVERTRPVSGWFITANFIETEFLGNW